MVQLTLLERELVDMFMSTFQGPYIDRMVGSASSGFSHLVIAGEQIENYLKNGKIQDIIVVVNGANKPHSGFPKKKEGETNPATTTKGEDRVYQVSYYQVAAIAPNQYQQQTYAIPTGPPPMQYQQSYAPQRHNHYQQGQQKEKKPERMIDMVPMSYSQLLAHLLRGSLVQLMELESPSTPHPQSYNANARCEFHSGTPEHTIENCRSFKYKMQNLIDSKAISFTPNDLNILYNLMPPYAQLQCHN